MDINVVRLGREDVALAGGMVALFREAFGDPAVDARPVPRLRYLETLLDQEAFYAIAAIDGDRVVGGVTAYEMPMFLSETGEAYLYDIAVHDDYRRKGIATTLLSKLEHEARRNGISTIFVEAEADDAEAVSFYRSTGAKMLDVSHFTIDLTREQVS